MDSEQSGLEHVSQQKSFDAQFLPEKNPLFGGVMRSVDITPETPHPDKSVPVLFAPGWSGNPEAYKGSLRMLSQKGRRVLSLDQMRHGGEVNQAYASYTELVKKRLVEKQTAPDMIDAKLATINEKWQELSELPKPTLRRALTILALLEIKDTNADIVGHSEGGIDAAAAKFLNPDRVNNLVLLATGGMIGEDTMIDVAKRNAQQGKLEKDGVNPLQHTPTDDEEAEAQLAQDTAQMDVDQLTPGQIINNVARYVGGNPVRAVAEARAIGLSQIDGLLRVIRKDGGKIAMVNEVDDPNAPMQQLQGTESLTAEEKEALGLDQVSADRTRVRVDQFDEEGKLTEQGSVDAFVSIQGHHNTHAAEPRVMGWVDTVLTKFDQKQQEKDATLTE